MRRSRRAGVWRLVGEPEARLEEPRVVVAEQRARLVVVVVDTLRDDHLRPELMPRTLAALAGARRFADTLANAPWTLPSMASLLTSRPVLELTAPDGALIGIPAGVSTLADRYAAAGFATAAFVANGTLREGNGFGRGFGRFATTGSVGAPPTDAAHLLGEAAAWIEGHSGEDALLWVHLMEPHEPLRDHHGPGREVPESRVLAGRERAATKQEAGLIRELYRGEVRYLDSHLGPFLSALPASATIALVADHGEMLGEGTVWGHGLTVYEPVLRVPFLLRAPGGESGLDESPVELLDFAPTLLARSGLATAGLAGRDVTVGDRPRRARLAATFSAGPLRWSWRLENDAVVAHFAPQEDFAPPPQVALQEQDPLPFGWRHFARASDPAHPSAVLPPGLLARVAPDFAADVGGLAPGIQVLGIDVGAGQPLVVEAAGKADVVQLVAAASTVERREGSRLSWSWAEPQPLALVVLGTGRVRPAGEGWAVGRDQPPVLRVPGRALWRNPRDATVQAAQDEILARLKALGYLR